MRLQSSFALLLTSLLGTLVAAPRPSHAQACDLSGTWAVRFHVPVSWRFNSGIEGGQGALDLQALMTLTDLGNGSYAQRMVPCGRSMPPTRSHLLYGGERYGQRFLTESFDAGTLPVTESTLMAEGQENGVGAHLAGTSAAFVYGLALANPVTDTFPERYADAIAAAVDVDGDGRPGLRIDARSDSGLSLPPVNARQTRRAVSFDMVGRDLLRSSVQIRSCDLLEGEAAIESVQGKPGLQASIVGCQLTDGSDCVRADLSIVNGFAPRFTPSAGQVAMVRLGAQAQCADVRTALPMP